MRLHYARVVLCIFLISTKLSAASCEDWFKKSQIDPNTKTCFSQCIVLLTGMDTFGCPMECSKFCKFAKHVWIYFGNGMFNTRRSATDSAQALSAKFLPYLDQYPDLRPMVGDLKTINIAYNLDEALFLQLLQVFEQKVGADTGNFWRWVSSFALAPEWFQKTARDIALHFDKTFQDYDRDLKGHRPFYFGFSNIMTHALKLFINSGTAISLSTGPMDIFNKTQKLKLLSIPLAIIPMKPIVIPAL